MGAFNSPSSTIESPAVQGLAGAVEIGVVEFTMPATIQAANSLGRAWLGIPDTGSLPIVASDLDPRLLSCISEAERHGTVTTALVRATADQLLFVTAARLSSVAGVSGSVVCLLQRAPRKGASSQPTRDPELLEAMVDASEGGLMIVSGRGVVLDVNSGSVFPKDEVVGRNVRELVDAGYFDRSISLEVIRTRTTVTTIQTIRDGRKLLVTAKPIFSPDGGLRYVVVTDRDITELSRIMSRLEETTKLSDRYRTELRMLAMRDVDTKRIVVRSAPMRSVHELAVRCAAVDSPVLLLGETGTGKSAFAKLIHQVSSRRAGPFLELNCGAIPEGLLEAELFGYLRGAFTGADPRGKVGLLELAHAGTLLLNEIGDLPLALQVKLLRFLEDGEIQPIGAVKPRRPDVRIIAATNRNLTDMIRHSNFRQDLFYRLNVLSITIPPLREHREDIPWLVDMMLAQLEQKLRRRRKITPAALTLIAQYSFPGNIRELWNIIERLVVTTEAETIAVPDLPTEVSQARTPTPEPWREGTLRQALQRVEAAVLKEAIERYGSQVAAARHLGVGQATVSRKLRRYRLG